LGTPFAAPILLFDEEFVTVVCEAAMVNDSSKWIDLDNKKPQRPAWGCRIVAAEKGDAMARWASNME